MQNGNSRILFITDLIVMFIFFFLVFRYYTGGTMISLKGNILMGLIVIYWFLISVNSNVLQINRLSTTISVSKDILIAYSVLSTITIATVAIFDEFRPNDKLILYPAVVRGHLFDRSTLILPDHQQTMFKTRVSAKIRLAGRQWPYRQTDRLKNIVNTSVGFSAKGSIVR